MKAFSKKFTVYFDEIEKLLKQSYDQITSLNFENIPESIKTIEESTKYQIFSVIYQLMGMTIITTVSDKDYEFTPTINYTTAKRYTMKIIKKLKVIFKEQFKDQNEQINRILNAVIDTIQQSMQKIQNSKEGFYSDDSQIYSLDTKKIVTNKEQLISYDVPSLLVQELRDKIKEQENLIKDLKLKIDIRNRQIKQATDGYVKDILHLKESIYRKNNSYNEFNYYEVKYFEDTEIADPKIRDICNERLESLRIKFMNQQNELITKMTIQNQNPGQKFKPESTFQLIKRALEQDSNPYHIWKIIQDLQGGLFFMDIFEKQSPLEGINYREVNRIIQSGQLRERDYFLFKDHIKCHYQTVSENRQKILEQIDKQMQTTLLQMNEWSVYVGREISKVKSAFLDQLRETNEYNFKLQNQQVSISQSYEDMYNRQCRKLMFTRWIMISKLRKQLNEEQIKKMIKTLTKSELAETIKQKFIEREFKIKQIFLKTLNSLEYLNNKIQDKEIEQYSLKTVNQLNLGTIKFLENKIRQLEHSFHLKSEYLALYEASYNNLLRAIDPSFIQKYDSMDNINTDIIQKVSQKGFKLQVFQQRLIGEINEQHQYLQSHIKSQLQPKITYQNQSSLTDLFDLNYQIKLERLSKNSQVQLQDIQQELIREFLNDRTIVKIFVKDEYSYEIKDQEVQTTEFFQTQNITQINKFTEDEIQVKQRLRNSPTIKQQQNNVLIQTFNYNQQKEIQAPLQSWLNQSLIADNPQQQFNTRYSSFDANRVPLQSKLNKIQYRRKVGSVVHQRSKLEVFTRLYNDSEKKRERMKQLSDRIRQMDKNHWEDVIHLIHEVNEDSNVNQPKQFIFNPNQQTNSNPQQRIRFRETVGNKEDFSKTINNKVEFNFAEELENRRKNFIESCIQDFEHQILRVSKLDQQIMINQKLNRTMENNIEKVLNIQEELEAQKNNPINYKKENIKRKFKLF